MQNYIYSLTLLSLTTYLSLRKEYTFQIHKIEQFSLKFSNKLSQITIFHKLLQTFEEQSFFKLRRVKRTCSIFYV